LNRRRVTIEQQHWPYRHPIAISREVFTGQNVIVVTLVEGDCTGRGEGSPTTRYGESVASSLASLQQLVSALESGLDRAALQNLLPPGAARNAVDCALWDLQAKQARVRVWELAGLADPCPLLTTQTIGLDSPEIMAAAAARAWSSLLKLKLGGHGDIERVRAVRSAAPHVRLIVDANEAWSVAQLETFPALLAPLGVELIEQPLPAGDDASLERIRSPIPIGADESFHGSAMIERMLGRYQVVNIKLDKTGGLTEALRAKAAAESAGLDVMIGCMGGTSLAMAPALLLAGGTKVVDLDGPPILTHDISGGLHYERGVIGRFGPDLWG
jgi:L-alanine-DL-glutamate epimerase-like enolase superfamily enzyme